MSKRKARRDSDDSHASIGSDDGPAISKLARRDSLPDEPVVRLEDVCNDVLKELYKLHDGGRPLWEMFEELPSEEDFPIYYDNVKDPIDLQTMKKKIAGHKYTNFDHFEKDFLLMVKNAHAFNEPGSQIYRDASALKKAFLAKKGEMDKELLAAKPAIFVRLRRGQAAQRVSVDSEPSSSINVDEDGGSANESIKEETILLDEDEHGVFATLFNLVVTHTDSHGRALYSEFYKLPSRKLYPDYYKIIAKPFSFQKLRSKIRGGNFTDLNVLERDLNLIFDNAMEFNETNSMIYKDAKKLQSYMRKRKAELEKSPEYLSFREDCPKRGRPRLRHNPEAEGDKEFESEPEQKAVKIEDDAEPVSVPAREIDSKLHVLVSSLPSSALPKEEKKKKSVLRNPQQPSSEQVDSRSSMKKRMKDVYKTIRDHKDHDGRTLSEIFMELPSEEEYPDYYKVIPNPIDMDTILEKISTGQYDSEEAMFHDFEIMFANACHYNEEGSEVYKDALTLGKVLKKKKRLIVTSSTADNPKIASPLKPGKLITGSTASTAKRNTSSAFPNKCQELLYHIKDYTDDYGRSLSLMFDKLPSKAEYPDYYQLIKKPIDLQSITLRINKYVTLDELEQDLLQMFHNACVYNEPDSQIYKDALTLQRAMIRKRQELTEDDSCHVSDVQFLVQGLLYALYSNLMSHRDEEGRCFSDSLVDIMAETGETSSSGPCRKPITLLIIGKLLKLGLYKRLDQLQEDLFAVFKKARQERRTDSEAYEDACELQVYFMEERDRMCRDGLRLSSPALNDTKLAVQREMDLERKVKLEKENMDDEKESEEDTRVKGNRSVLATVEVVPDEDSLVFSDSATFGGISYKVGDFVYVRPEESSIRPWHIVSVERIWTQEKDGLQGIYGVWYYRPKETFHLASRKFLEKEVFRSLRSSYIVSSGVIRRCFVMNVKEYFRLKPEGFTDEDVYVCESRYNDRTRTFKKLKGTQCSVVPAHINLVPREEHLAAKRVPSVFSSASEQGNRMRLADDAAPEVNSLEGYEFDIVKKNVETDVANPEPGFVYYESYWLDSGCYKLGDAAYVRSDEDYPYMAQIEKIWTNAEGKPFFLANWYLRPEEAKHMPTQMFFEQECFQSNVEEVTPMENITGKCFIQFLRDYQICRPTEIPEREVFVCQARYDESDGTMKKTKAIKKYSLSSLVREDEFWYFDQPYNPRKRPSLWLMDSKDFDEKDPGSADSVKRHRGRDNMGYMLLKKELAAVAGKQNPAVSLEEIEKKAVDEWNNLPAIKKQEYQARARAHGIETSDPGDCGLFIYECGWPACDYQYEDIQDLMVHVMEGGHLVKAEDGLFPCRWKGCVRDERGLKPFPTHSRLARHIREVHFKMAYKRIQPLEKSKNYFARHQGAEHAFKSPEPLDGSEERCSSRSSSTNSSSLSPFSAKQQSAMIQQRHLQHQMQMGLAPGGSTPVATSLQMQPNTMFPPYRLTSQQQLAFQQQMMQHQQHMMMAAARGLNPAMLAAPSRPPTSASSMLSPTATSQPMTPAQQQAPFQPAAAVPSGAAPPGVPLVNPGQPPGQPLQAAVPSLLTLEQQHMLIQQVQRQQQQIQKLQDQVQQYAHAQTVLETTPVFVAPPASTQKLRHSEAYLR